MTKHNTINLKDISRSVHVTRWHSVGVHRNQSIAEHSFAHAMYSEALALNIKPDLSPNEHLTIIRYSMWHDMAEVVTGDLCTPLKRLLEGYFKDKNPLDELEENLCPQYKALKEAMEGTPLRRIAKLADYLDAIVFLEDEGKEKQAHVIKDKIMARYQELISESKEKYPDLNWNAAHQVFSEVMHGEATQIDFVWDEGL